MGRQPGRAWVIVLLAGVLGLQSADMATVGATGAQLESAFDISHLQLGLLASVTSLLTALGTLPFGLLADRAPRVRVLAVAIALWGVAMIGAGFAVSYGTLLVARIFLGLMTAASGPLLASLMGDLFPGAERAGVYGVVLSGELVGFGAGFLLSGNIAGVLSWRWAFWCLAPPAAALAFILPRALPEPARGGQRALDLGEIAPDAEEARPPAEDVDAVAEEASEPGLRAALAAILTLRSNVVLISVSATLYFYLGGLQTFAVIWLRHQYSLGQSVATSLLSLLGIGALAGVVGGGRLGDRLLRSGLADARIVVAAAGLLVAVALVFAPFLRAWPLPLAVPLFIAGTAALASSIPTLDAARLDVMPAPLWGRAESIRTALRGLGVAAAPLVFAGLSTTIGEGGGKGLRLAFVLMLAPVALAGIVLVLTRRRYTRDVATVASSGEASP
jgi:predicted MFS family arabinose efflux permease